jgi:hypothetical protein
MNESAMTHEDLDLTDAEMAALMTDDEEPKEDTQQAAEPPEEAPAEEASKDAVAEDPPVEKPVEKPAEPEVKPQGDVRAALRAARRGEHKARQEAERLRRENEELKSRAASLEQSKEEDITDEELETLSADSPVAAKAVKVLRAKMAAIAKQAPAPVAEKQADPEFEPPTFDPQTQEDIDSTPDLLAWQHSPDQTAFRMAVAEDAKLQNHPKWKGKPQAERFAEVARRVKAEFSEADPPTPTPQPPPKPKANVDEAIANAQRIKPRSLSDIGGGGESTTVDDSLGRYSRMSDEDIEADLLMGP